MSEKSFIDKLIESIRQKNNPSVVGLDPRIDMIPEQIKTKYFKEHGKTTVGAAYAVFEFNKMIIDAIYDLVPAVKPQMAFYEAFGQEGIKCLVKTIDYAKSRNLLVICDGKRNDIGTTAKAYSDAYLGETSIDGEISCGFSCDALTINPYLGYDGILPFSENCAAHRKGVFVLVKTSNKSSGEIQDLETKDGRRIFEIVAEKVSEWGKDMLGVNGYSSVGAVVGATYPEQAKILRKIMKNAYILVPGYGAQGGDAEGAVNCFNNDGLGAIVNASRSIIFAYKQERHKSLYGESGFAEAARTEAIRMRNDINGALERKKQIDRKTAL